ncbi:serine/threonine-protein phosphatase 1 regulatory subunit 10-like isoform X2 [Rhopilema esculentum]|uniref:serine/threonine-protein phosphatase 1 regulatory subunit 10-like isoform X2 n=1 Tax=Rhopilema esculentum TaxID=499914 RepID=UPI0031E292DB
MGNLREEGFLFDSMDMIQDPSSESENLNPIIVRMGSSGGEPRMLLNALKPMLGIDGDIKTPQEVLRVVGLMKDAEKMMSRCIYLNILRATCDQSKGNLVNRDTLERFLTSGGWGILNKWLNEYAKSENVHLLLEIIEVLKCLPVTINTLKQGNTGKVVKQLTKSTDPDLRKGAMYLIKEWKGMIRGGNNNDKGSKSNSKDAEKTGDECPVGTIKRQRQGSTEEKIQPPPEKKPKQTDEKQRKNSLDSKPVAMESFGLMNAMVAVASKPIKKKKKPLTSKTTLPLDEILNNKSVNGDKNSDKPYASPLRGDQEREKGENKTEEDTVDQTAKNEDEDSQDNEKGEQDKDRSGPPSKKAKKTKRSITWANEENLIKVCYFELDEEELASMHHTMNFSMAKHNELVREREALENARRLGEDRMVEKAMWKKPCLVEMSPLSVEAGEKSREKYIQKEREQKVLADIFLTKASLPDSPAEPDSETEEHGPSEPKLIPHDEEGTLYPKPSVPVQQAASTSLQTNSTQSKSDATAKANDKPGQGNSLLGDPTAEMLAKVKDPDVSPSVHNIMKHIMVPKPGSPQDFPRLGGPEFMGRGARPMGPDVPGPGFPPGVPRFPIRGGVPRPPMNVFQGRPRGNFRGRPMMHRGGPLRPRFHGPPMVGMHGEDHFDMGNEEEHFRGRGRGRGGPHMRGRGKPPLCRHFMTPTGCRNGQACKFVHPMMNGPPPR